MVTLTLKRSQRPILTRHFTGRSLDRLYDDTGKLVQKLTQQQFMIPFWISRELPIDEVAPGRPRGLESGREFWISGAFLILKDEIPDSLDVSVRFRLNDETFSESRSFPLVVHEPKNACVFPLSGLAMSVSGPAVGHSHHRATTSQEFGYDIVLLDREGRLTEGQKNEAFEGFNKPILAPAGGEVVVAKDGLPDNPGLGEPPGLTSDRIDAWGIDHAASGNYIVIDHGDGEFSFLAHAKNGSVLVQAGDSVTQGQEIARLGNSGNSTAPHLHYHMMDGPDLLKSRSLPVKFTNTRAWPSLGDDDDEPDFWAQPNPLVVAERPSG